MKKTPKKIIKKEEKSPEVIEARFQLNELRMINLQWQAKMSVTKILPKSYHDYKIKMILDESPYLKSIEDYELERKQIGHGQQTLIPEMMEARKNELHDLIVEERQRLEKKREECKKIEFIGEVKELKYKDGDTIILMRLPDNVIEEINQMKFLFAGYKIELTPKYD